MSVLQKKLSRQEKLSAMTFMSHHICFCTFLSGYVGRRLHSQGWFSSKNLLTALKLTCCVLAPLHQRLKTLLARQRPRTSFHHFDLPSFPKQEDTNNMKMGQLKEQRILVLSVWRNQIIFLLDQISCELPHSMTLSDLLTIIQKSVCLWLDYHKNWVLSV